jgi:hypothetical protein
MIGLNLGYLDNLLQIATYALEITTYVKWQ